MYSWIASWVTGETEEVQQNESLYVENKESTPSNDWTWIEVIEDKKDDTVIFVQTSEQGPKIVNERQDRRLKRQRRKGMLAEKLFANSLYIDEPLYREPVPSIKRSKSLPIENTLVRLSERPNSISEVLSSTFPQQPILDMYNNVTVVSQVQIEPVIKQILKLMREKNGLFQDDIQHLCDTKIFFTKNKQLSIEWKPNQQSIEWKKPQLAIEWESIPALEWHRKQSSIERGTDLMKEIQTTYYLPKWMRKIQTLSDEKVEETVPLWLQKIDFTLFDENNTTEFIDMPEWLRNIDIEIDLYNRLPGWLARIYRYEEKRVNKGQTDIVDIPSWMKRIDVIEEKIETPVWMQYTNINSCGQDRSASWGNIEISNRGSSSWMQWEDVETIFDAGVTEGKVLLRRVSETQAPVVKSLKTLCGNVMSVAALIVACEVCVDNECGSVMPRKSVIISRKRRNASMMSPRALKRKTKYDLSTNKRSQLRKNRLAKRKRTKRSPTAFSRMGGLRAC